MFEPTNGRPMTILEHTVTIQSALDALAELMRLLPNSAPVTEAVNRAFYRLHQGCDAAVRGRLEEAIVTWIAEYSRRRTDA